MGSDFEIITGSKLYIKAIAPAHILNVGQQRAETGLQHESIDIN